MSLNGIKELLLGSNPVGLNPADNYIFKWIEIDGSDFVYKAKDSNGDIFNIGVAGPIGPEGPIGPQGIQGIVGPQGPAGPADLAHRFSDDSLVTLPDVTTLTFIEGYTFAVPSDGQYIMQAQVSISPYSTSKWYQFEWQLDGAPIAGNIEVATSSAANIDENKPFLKDLGLLTAGSYDMDLYFRKQNSGGSFTKNSTRLFIWRVS